jgi:hypothetical protein
MYVDRASPGDLTYANLASADVVIINTLSAAKALFEAKGLNYSDRPSLFFLCDIVGWRELPILMNFGAEIVSHRRLLRDSIGTRQLIDDMDETNRMHTFRCIRRIFDEPERLERHIRTFVI